MNFNRALAVARKEMFHILRDPFTLGLALFLPVILVAIFGLAIEFNIQNIDVAIFDGDRTQSSTQYIDRLGSSNYFRIQGVYSPGDAMEQVDANQARAAIIIKPGFERDLLSGGQAEVQAILDGSDSSTIGNVMGYLTSINRIAVSRMTGHSAGPPIEVKTRFLFNSELNSRWFTIPGLMAVVIGMLSILLTSLTVAREWENGSMELLLSTPIQPIEIIVGKLAPYVGLGMGAVVFVYVTARLAFEVPFRGSHLLFILACGLFLLCYLSMGLLISVITRKQQIAMQGSMMAGLLPALLLSGFIFPIESMPTFFYYFTAILPARWFVEISRNCFLVGAGIGGVKLPFLMLSVLAGVLIFLALKRFKRDLEP